MGGAEERNEVDASCSDGKRARTPSRRFQPLVAQETTHMRPVLLFHVRVIVLAIGTTAREVHPAAAVPKVAPEVMVQKLAPVIAIKTGEHKGERFFHRLDLRAHSVRAFVRDRAQLGPATENIGRSQAPDEVAAGRFATGQCVRTFFEHTSTVQSVCVSSDARWALSASADKTLRLWNIEAFTCSSRRWHAPALLCRVATTEGLAENEIRYRTLLSDAQAAILQKRFGQALVIVREARRVPGYGHAEEAMHLWSVAGLQCVRRRYAAGWCARILRGHLGWRSNYLPER